MPKTELPRQTVGEPTWEVAYLFPARGCWTEEEYRALQTNRLVELSDGDLEVLPMPTEEHQAIVAYLYRVICAFVSGRHLGKVLFAPLRVRLWEARYREPDVVLMLAEHADRRHNEYWDGADLVVEVVSEDDPERDWTTKRDEYARAGIAEYWIADSRDGTITVHALDEQAGRYRVAGRYGRGEEAVSVLLSGLKVDVAETFSQGE